VNPYNATVGAWGWRGRWNSGDLAGELGRGSGSRGSRGGEGPVGVLFCGGRNAGGRARRRPAAAAAGSLAPVSRWLGWANKREGRLLGTLGKVGTTSVGGASDRCTGSS
jgi:hypothetical protein